MDIEKPKTELTFISNGMYGSFNNFSKTVENNQNACKNNPLLKCLDQTAMDIETPDFDSQEKMQCFNFFKDVDVEECY